MLRNASITLLVALVCVCAVRASKVKVWHHATAAIFEKGQLKGIAVSNEGVVRLSRSMRPLASLDATHIWDVIEDGAGNLFVATGDDGKVFKVAPSGKVSVALDTHDSQVLCMAL